MATESETLSFSADVSRLLDIVVNALYTNKDVFLRELISNAADACDRLRYEALQKPDLTADNPHIRIHIYKDTVARTFTILDNGIGMNRKELTDNLGTIAKSGTAALMEKMGKAGQKDALSLIGQFGVGFYASYMVADKVTVVSRKAGAKAVNAWDSDGRSGFTVRGASGEEAALLDGARGTAVILHLKDDASEFLIDEKIRQVALQYSDHIDVKIFLGTPQDTDKGEGQPLNSAAALWMRPKSEITKEQYDAFYKHITHGFDEPLMTSHWRAEGKIEYTALLFIPTLRPWDLYDPTRKQAVKLYVRRVLIAEDMEGLVYPWLRFLRGVVDSADLPLNISRETLQHNPLLAKIRSGIAKRILADLDKLSRDDPPAFLAFWGQFGAALKEGLYDAPEHRDDLFKVCRFFSTHGNGEKLASLEDYLGRMDENQADIFYITGENVEGLKSSPQIEGLKAAGREVLFFTDTIDDFWLQQISEYKGKKFKSVTKGDIDMGAAAEAADEKPPEDIAALAARMKEILSGEVGDVRLSRRLTDSPVCLVAPEGGVDMHMERVLKIHQKYAGETKPVLEINPGHPLVQKLAGSAGDIGDAAHLLLDQARIIQGQPLKNPAEFARRMSAALEKNLA